MILYYFCYNDKHALQTFLLKEDEKDEMPCKKSTRSLQRIKYREFGYLAYQ